VSRGILGCKGLNTSGHGIRRSGRKYTLAPVCHSLHMVSWLLALSRYLAACLHSVGATVLGAMGAQACSAKIAGVRSEYWQEFSPLPFEVGLDAGRKAKEEPKDRRHPRDAAPTVPLYCVTALCPGSVPLLCPVCVTALCPFTVPLVLC